MPSQTETIQDLKKKISEFFNTESAPQTQDAEHQMLLSAAQNLDMSTEQLDTIGKILFHEQNYNNALEVFKKYVEISPDDARANNNLGAVYICLEDYKTATAFLLKAVKTDPGNAVFNDNLGTAYVHRKMPNLARECLEKSIHLNKENGEEKASPYISMAQVWLAVGNKPKALANAKKALEIATQSNEALKIEAAKYLLDNLDNPNMNAKFLIKSFDPVL